MAKLTRESRLRERRLDKAARKTARKLEAAQGETEFAEMVEGADSQPMQDPEPA